VSQKAIEVILARQLASYLAMPIFIVDHRGTLVYYNEPAERALGLRFDETGEMPAMEWSTRFRPTDGHGKEIPAESIPLTIALRELQPAHGKFWIKALDGQRRHIEVTAFPLIGEAGRNLGAIAIFWETPA
jgi:PAS domain S-box-containing protein